MIKKFILLSLVASQLMVSCSSDDSPTTDPTLEEQIANLVKQPYSKLTPTEQKSKLEVEANEMLVQLDKSKSSSAIEAIENLNRLLDINTVDIFNGKNDNEVEDILNIAGAYGIYTWNNTKKIWDKTASTTELKFVFPAKESLTTNNAVFSSKGVSSDVKIKYYDGYNGTEEVSDNLFLPSSSDATLTIDNKEAAKFTQTAKYSSKNQSPDEFAYKMSLNDGYVWEMSGSKGTANTSKATLTYNGKSLISFNAGSNSEIDKLIDNDELVQYRGKANGLSTLMDNFVIVADMDLATSGAEDAALEKSLVFPVYPDSYDPKSDFKAYYTAVNAYYKKSSEGDVANFNKNYKLILVSKKDGTKIAEIVEHSEKREASIWDTFNLPMWDANNKYWYWNDKGESFTRESYDEVTYLKFSDNTEVEMSAYFSTGFEKLQTKFDDFVAAFNKQ
ncbi:hypothetical protein [Flavobacterium sp. KACC 22763]|uniref:hypothetical protein n=1 Tax=Flavobacterium sp. KACC 22763 TaxID=3025668 RepID=UPI002365F4BA|nr:hypothetical protein [Flavobacterium sp. KACC 22763]WDF64182.1 hypothetical protein PQ463_21490 [Flavobacterium sp. KACC 22763]